MSEAQREMPKYKCHKVVHALKIGGIIKSDRHDPQLHISPMDEGFAPFLAPTGWEERFKGSPSDYGYYVVYQGGYASWSPTKDFEEGYTRI